MNYTCTMCKKQKVGEPQMTNGAGSFCHDCREIMIKRSSEAAKRKREEFDGSCVYCGKQITTKDPSAMMAYGGGAYTSHASCDNKRDWVLSCIRNSDHIVKYVNRTEDKEGPLREKRKKQELEIAKSKTQHKLAKSTGNDTDRIDRLEQMIERLTSALGGV